MDLTDERRERAQAPPSRTTTAPGWSWPSLARSAGYPQRHSLDLGDGGAMERSAPALSAVSNRSPSVPLLGPLWHRRAHPAGFGRGLLARFRLWSCPGWALGRNWRGLVPSRDPVSEAGTEPMIFWCLSHARGTAWRSPRLVLLCWNRREQSAMNRSVVPRQTIAWCPSHWASSRWTAASGLRRRSGRGGEGGAGAPRLLARRRCRRSSQTSKL